MNDPLRETTLKKYMKARSELRVDGDAVVHLMDQINARVQIVVDRAAALAEMEERTTLLQRDVERALVEVGRTKTGGGSTGPQLKTSAVFDAIESYSVDELSELAKQIEASLDA